MNIETIEGLLRLTDNWTPVLEKADRATAGSIVSFGFFERAGQQAFDVIANSASNAIGYLISFAQTSVQKAMEVVESESLAAVSFGDMTQKAVEWSQGLSKSLGLNEFELRKQAATLYNMTTSMGMSKTAAFDMSTGIVKLAADMASFRNMSIEVAFQKIRAGIVGESEPLKALGILIDENTIKQVAYTAGIAKHGAQLTAQEKVSARWLAILQQTKNDQGDLARTIDSPTNALRVMQAQTEQFSVKIGQSLLPAMQGWIMIQKEVLSYILANEIQIKSLITSGLMALTSAIGFVVQAVAIMNEGFLQLRLTYIEIIGWLTKLAFAYEFMQRVKEHPLQLAAAWEELKVKTQATEFVTNKMKATAEGQAQTMRGLVVAVGLGNEKFKGMIEASKNTTSALAGATTATDKMTDAQKNNVAMTKEQIAAAKKHADEIARMVASISDVGVAAARAEGLSKLEEVISKLGGSSALSANEVNRLAAEAKKLGPEGVEWAQSLIQSTNVIPVMRTGFNTLVPVVKEVSKQIKTVHLDLTAGKSAGDVFVSSFKDSLKELPKVILGAIQGGGDVGKSIGSFLGGSIGESLSKAFGKTITGALGETLGGALNSILPGIGSLVGSAFGGLMDKLFGPSEIMKVNDMRDAFFQAHGGFAAFGAEMAKVSGEDWAAKIFKAKTVEEFNALVKEAEGLLNMQTVAEEKLKEAVDRYGFTIEELGPKWAAQELDKKAAGLLQDYELLVASGIDVNTVIEKMGPNLNEYVNTARKAGQAIPENMRPIIEKMIEQGQLLDENGNAFSSVEDAGISFTKSLSQGLQEAVDAIKQLVAALTGIPVNVPPIHVPVVYDDPGYDGGHHGPSEEVAAASGFVGTVTGPTRFLTGERGPEDVFVGPPGSLSGGGVSNAAVVSAINGLRQDLAETLPYVLGKTLRDNLQQSR